jgi:putative membrane protein
MRSSVHLAKFMFPLAAALLVLSARGAAGSSLGSDDTDFVKKAAKANIAEVQLSRLALKKSTSPEVKEFATTMIHDHTKANVKLSTLASSKGVKMPDSKSFGADASYAKLKMLSGKSFDESYVKTMVDDHKDAVELFSKVSRDSQDADVKRFATKTLPALQEHQSKIEKIQSNMAGTQ